MLANRITVTLNDHELHPTQLVFLDAEYDIDEYSVRIDHPNGTDVFPTPTVKRIQIVER